MYVRVLGGRLWKRSAWAELAGADVWLFVTELAELFGIRGGAVKYWASVEKWRRNGPRGTHR
jgi:hypothetical protein